MGAGDGAPRMKMRIKKQIFLQGTSVRCDGRSGACGPLRTWPCTESPKHEGDERVTEGLKKQIATSCPSPRACGTGEREVDNIISWGRKIAEILYSVLRKAAC